MTSTPQNMRQALKLWPTLEMPDRSTLPGRWEASFVKPLRVIAPAGLGLIGLPRWYGKDLTAEGGINLLRTPSGLEQVMPMGLSEDQSWADGAPTLVGSYASGVRFPWRWVRDEFRTLDADTLLGLTFTDAPGLRAVGLPFLLERRESPADSR